MSNNALIGYTGFVGSTLLKQHEFQWLYRSTNIEDIKNKSFDTVVCAGAPAVKWLANKNPEQDKRSIELLMENLSTIKCDKFILISTVDVFNDPRGVNESSVVNLNELHAYGLHRYELEQFVKNKFSNCLIVRLPGLVGPGLKKNIIFDFLNANNLEAIDGRSVFQFYPMVNLWSDIKVAIDNKVKLLHLTSFPISTSEIAKECFNVSIENKVAVEPVSYDFQTEFAEVYGSGDNYQYSKKEVLTAIRYYAQSENKKGQL